MKIKDLIKSLKEIEDKYGDVDIYIIDDEYGDTPIKRIYPVTDWENKFMHWGIQ